MGKLKTIITVMLGVILCVAIHVASVSGDKVLFIITVLLASLIVILLRNIFDATVLDVSEPVKSVNATIPTSIASISKLIYSAQDFIEISSGHFSSPIWDSYECKTALEDAINRGVKVWAIALSDEVSSKAIRELSDSGKIELRFYTKENAARKPHFVVADSLHIRSEKRDLKWCEKNKKNPNRRRPALIRYECPYLANRAHNIFQNTFKLAEGG